MEMNWRILGAREELEQRLDEGVKTEKLIRQIARSWVPTNNSELLECCFSDPTLFYQKATHSTRVITPAKVVATNVYNRLVEDLKKHYANLKQEKEI